MSEIYTDEQRMIDEGYMRHALALAAKGRGTTTPNPMVGAVVVKDGRIIGEGYHIRAGEGHAEVNAFKNCTEDPEGATIYVTLEPCSHYGKTPPCADLVVSKKVARCVVAAMDPNPLVAGRGVKKIQDAGIEVITGVLADESVKLNEVFMKFIVTNKPFVLFKAAMSLDGKIATATGESQWISCEASREEVHRLRHAYTGIMAGIGTVLADDPMLNCRMEGAKQPVRIIVDSRLRIPMSSKLVQTAKAYPLVIACLEDPDEDKKKALTEAGARVLETPANAEGHVDLLALMEMLGLMKIDSILLEGGGILADSAFRAGIIDKVQIYIAPMIIGGESAKTPVEGIGIAALADSLKLTDVAVEMSGCDVKVTGSVKGGN